MKNLIIYLILIIVSLIDFQIIAQETKNIKSDPNTPIFEIKNDQEQTVFAVYPGGVKIFIDEQLKAAGGGFTVGRLSTGKATAGDILSVNPNNVNIYIDDASGVKAAGGGFTVGRLSTGKASGESVDFLRVTADSTRINVSDSVKGFAVSNIQEGVRQDFMDLNKQNYLIGHQTGAKITTGIYNSMFGYQAGFNTTAGSNSLFLGYRSGYSNVGGGNNVYIGTESGYSSQNTFQNTFVGYRSGYSLTSASNTAFGSMAGENAGGGNNTFIGTSAGRLAVGGNNTFVGAGAGYSFPNENAGIRNTYIGQSAGAFTSTGDYNVMLGFNAGYLNYEGSNNTFLGYDAGRNIHNGSGNVFIGYQAGGNVDGLSNQLYIGNSNTSLPLIFGEFDNKTITVNGSLYYTGEFASTSDLRLKTNLLQFTSGLEVIMSLQAYYFDWNLTAKNTYGYPDKKQLGLVAQEVEKLLPEIVSTSPNGYKAIDYSKMVPVLVQAVKEQNKLIQNQEERITKLEASNNLLKIELEKMEQLKADIDELKTLINTIQQNNIKK